MDVLIKGTYVHVLIIIRTGVRRVLILSIRIRIRIPSEGNALLCIPLARLWICKYIYLMVKTKNLITIMLMMIILVLLCFQCWADGIFSSHVNLKNACFLSGWLLNWMLLFVCIPCTGQWRAGSRNTKW